MRRVFAFFSSRPFVSIGIVIGILTLINVALVFAVADTGNWQMIYLQNGTIFIGRATHEGSFVRIADVHLLKQLPTQEQKVQATHFSVQGAIDSGFDVKDFELSEVMLSQGEVKFITTIDRTSPIIRRLNQLHAHGDE